MPAYDYDLFTVGAGSGGVRASRVAAKLGARVAVAEERYLGGTCVNVGCIPKKLLVYASSFRDEFEDAASFGWQPTAQDVDWATLLANKNREISRLNHVYGQLLDEAGADRFEGRARVIDGHSVAIDDKICSAANILIATGSWPSLPRIPGIEHAITSNEAFNLPALPEHVVIVGGGYIAVEFASIFHGLGSCVTQLYRGPLFLRGFDDDVRRVLAEHLRKAGIDLHFDARVERIERSGAGGLRLALEGGGGLEADTVLYATGRLPLTRDLGLEDAKVELGEGGAVVVDAYSQSSVPSIWAIGDVTNRVNLTPVAIHEATCLAHTLFGDGPVAPDHANVPTAVFSQPPIGTVGLTEAQARERYGEIDVYRSRFRELKHSLTQRDQQALMKLVVDRASQRVVGAHMVGSHAGEILQGIAIAIKCGATKAQFDATVGIHPTSAEEFVTMREAVGDSP
jgi:glutathione reductase (NADPH)